MQDIAGFALNCNANDVAIAGVATDENGDFLIDIKDDGCAYPGDTVEFEATFELVSNSKERHDIGIYFVEDGDPNGDGAVTGQCSVSTIPYAPDPPWLDLDGTTDPLPGTNQTSGLQDVCGDVTKDRNPMRPKITIQAVCVDDDQDGFLNLPYCLSWRQSGSNEYCDSPLDAYPGAPSKCKCDDTFNVPIQVPPASLTVTKTVSTAENGTYADTASRPEPGGDFWFKVKVENKGIDPNNWVVLDSLTDDVYGDLDGQGTCDLTTGAAADLKLEANGSDYYECKFKVAVNGNSGFSQTDEVTASGLDTRQNRVSGKDTASVSLTDVMPGATLEKTASPTELTEPGGSVTFTVKVNNTSTASSDPLTITSLSDDIHGNLNGKGTCSVPQTIAYGGSYSCSFTASVLGNAGYYETDTVTAAGTDDEGNPVSPSDSATVTILDAAGDSGLTVVKTANPTTVFEPGGQVTFSITVTNKSTVDYVDLNSLEDDVYGNLDGKGNCDVSPAVELAPGGFYSCSFQAYVDLDAGESETDTVTASGLDDDGNTVTGSDSANVSAQNVPPSATVTKTAVSALVTFEVKVTNTSVSESLELDALMDDVFGNLMDPGNPDVYSSTCIQATLQKSGENGDTYTCEFEAYVTESPHTDTVTATVNDNDGSPAATPSDSAQVSFEED